MCPPSYPAAPLLPEMTFSTGPRYWATGAEEWCTTCLMTEGSKSGRMKGLQEQGEAGLTVGLILRPVLLKPGMRRSPGCV